MKKIFLVLMIFFVAAAVNAGPKCIPKTCWHKVDKVPRCYQYRKRYYRPCPPPYPIYERSDHWHS